MNDAKDARSNLRTSLRELRTNISLQRQQEAANSLAARCLSILDINTHVHVAGYFAVGGEISVDPILANIRSRGGFSYAPVLSAGNTLRFAPFDDHTPMIGNKFNIKEPDVAASDYLMPADLDAVLVPLVGFDSNRNRMGMGGGFYDRSFAHRNNAAGNPFLIGVAYDLQQAESVYPDWWDVKLDVIVTESQVIDSASEAASD